MPVGTSTRVGGASVPRSTDLASAASLGRPAAVAADSALPDLAQALSQDPLLARNHRLNVLNGLVAIVALNLATSFYAIYAQRLHASNTQIALLNSLPAVVMALSFLPAAQYLERTRHKRRLIAIVLVVTRVLVAGVGLASFLPASWASWWVVGVVALDALPSAFVVVGWQSYIGEVFPSGLRSQLFAVRNWWTGWSGMIAVLVAGITIDRLPFPFGYQLFFSLSALAGLFEAYFFYAMREPPVGSLPGRVGSTSHDLLSPRRRSLAERWTAIRAEWVRLVSQRTYARFLVAAFLFHAGWMGLWPVFTVYKLETLGANNTWMSLMVVASNIGSIFTYRWWSRRADAKGNLWAVTVTAVLLAAVPAAWVVLARSLTVAVILDGLAGIAVGGFNLALFNLVLDLAQAERRATDVAYFNVLVQVAGFLAPLAGMALYNRWGFSVSMLVFTVGRLVGTVLIWKSQPRSRGRTLLQTQAAGCR